MTGQVRSTEGQPVANAAVRVLGTRLGTATDSAGQFLISQVPVGVREIEAYRMGRSSARATIVVRERDTVRVQLTLADVPTVLAGVTVIGSASDALSRVPGSAAIVSAAEIQNRQPVSANEVLRSVPGVHIQEEEGAGLRANIGIRGLDPDRSRTILVLEDGVPVALAPYGEPELYYSPPIDRMERVEVIKGSGSIAFGPQTIGGVINYVTADPPTERSGRIDLLGGTGGSRLLKGSLGGTWGRLRANASAFQRKADDYRGLFYDIRDVTSKFGARTGVGDFGLKLSVYDEKSNATYVGLTDSIFRASPTVHPQPDDRLEISRDAVTGTHEISLGKGVSLQTNAYAYRTRRDWNRREYTYSTSGSDYVFRNTTGSRNRSFEVIGVEPRLRMGWSLGGMRNEVDAGIRAHYERARDKHINGSLDGSVRVVRDNEIRVGRAIAGFVQNRIFVNPAFHVTPGVRLERFTFQRNVLRTRVSRNDPTGSGITTQPEDVDIRSSGAVTEVIPGIGAAWTPHALVVVFAGAHRGFAPPRTKDALIYENPALTPGQQVPSLVSLDLDAERSWNYELGTRLAPTHYLTVEATAFHLDFSNQIIEPSLSSGSVASARLANQGQTRHTGGELAASLDLGKMLRRSYSLSFNLAYTYADAVFAGERYLEIAGGDTVNVATNQLPYAPRNSASGAITLDHPMGLNVRIDGSFAGDQFSDNFETVRGSANGRTGLIPRRWIVDAAIRYRLPFVPSLWLNASAKNLADKTFIASRRPEGIKPGLGRIVMAGVNWSF
ncbi:MAG: TonB-dependent receptor domain-containing protein [Gemmatimonadaceae bacterium]